MQQPNNMKKETRFCSHCGVEMLKIKRGAEENMMFYGDMLTMPLAGAYDKNTGLRNYCWFYICPMWNDKKWYEIGGSPHDDYFINIVFN